jgi:hypothetical protein
MTRGLVQLRYQYRWYDAFTKALDEGEWNYSWSDWVLYLLLGREIRQDLCIEWPMYIEAASKNLIWS